MRVGSPFLFYCSKEAEVAAEDVIANMQKISYVLRGVSNLPGLSALAMESDALDNLIAHPDTVQKIYNGVEAGLSFMQAFVNVLREGGLFESVHFLTTVGPREGL